MQQGAGAPPFPIHFDGKRFFNPGAAAAPGLFGALRWKLSSRPERSARFVSDVEQIEAAVRVEGARAAGYADQSFDGAAAAKRAPYSDRSDLVGAGESAGGDRSAAAQEAGSAVGGSSAHRCRAAQPQSLRSPGSCDVAPAGGSWTISICRSDRSRAVAAIAEDRSGPRIGLGRIGCRLGGRGFTACRRCIFRREESSTAIGRCGADM